jgi:hypothetical protein
MLHSPGANFTPLLAFLCVQTMMAERAGADPNTTATVRRRWLEAAAFHLDTAISK